MFANGPKLVTQGLAFLVDAADPTSYPGSGTTWTDVVSRVTGSISGSVFYTSSFYGGFNFTGPTASVRFDGTNIANYGSGSFTVELAFRPARIEGIHYLISKNSGSFPSWGVYLSGSGGSGKLFSEFRISSTVSCSVSSSTTFVTGSNYQVDVSYYPLASGSNIFLQGNILGGGLGNGGGSLSSTGSLFLGNFSPSSSQTFSGSIYNTKIYGITNTTFPNTNYNAVATRFSLPTVPKTPDVNIEYLIVAGGGSGGSNGLQRYETAGGGAGGLLTGSFTLNNSIFISNGPKLVTQGLNIQVVVGDGGTGLSTTGVNGQNSFLGSVIALGGGYGGNGVVGNLTVGNGGSGGGAVSTTYATGSGTPGQGNNGGTSLYGGGGGGARTDGNGSNGGSGSFIASFAAIGGSPAGWFAGGGGGSAKSTTGFGGIGGGANGSSTSTPFTGSANTGGGGGGSVGDGTNTPSGKGGSGIVAIRYSGTPIALGGEITQSGGFTYHVYRTVGTSSFTIF